MATKKETINDTEEIKEIEIETPQEEEYVEIFLHKIKGEPEDVFVSINDRNWVIKRGFKVRVPTCVALVLQHSERMEEQAQSYEEYAQAASARHAMEVMQGLRNN